MDAFEERLRRLQADLDNLRQLIPRNGDDRQLVSPSPDLPVLPPPNPYLNIMGIEATQAIQYFNLTGEGSGAAPDNSIRMVDGKTTVLRVYPDISVGAPGYGSVPPAPTTITGHLLYHDRSGVYRRRTPMNDRIEAKTGAQVKRSNINDTLNFYVPGTDCTGKHVYSVNLFDPDHEGDWHYRGVSKQLWLDFVQGADWNNRYNKLPIYCVRIHCTGPDPSGLPVNWGPPYEPDMIATLSGSFLTGSFPIGGIDYVGSIPMDFNGDLSTRMAWNDLYGALHQKRAAYPAVGGVKPIFVGLLPREIATLQNLPIYGIGGGGVALGIAYESPRLTHEIGHAHLGKRHTPSPCPAPDPDLAYPQYAAYPRGSIGESGFNTDAYMVFDPASTYDFLAYCGPWWVSPYNYDRLFNSILYGAQFQPFRSAVDTGESAAKREYLNLNFRMHRDGTVELLPSFHMSDVRPLPPELPDAEVLPRSPVAFELRDGDRQVIEFHRSQFTHPAEVDPDGPYHDFHEMVPWKGETKFIAFFRDGGEVAEVEVEEQASEIRVRSVTKLDDGRSRIKLEWEAEDDTKPLTYLVRYSNDEGERWILLAHGLTEPKFDVDLDSLPGGEERCIFQIGASSTIRTMVAETEPLTVAVKPRRPYIVSPEPDSTFAQGESVVLRGVGYSPDFATAPPDEVVWTSNVAGFLGHGYEVFPETLAPGLHKITLGVADGCGGEASADVLIRIKPRE